MRDADGIGAASVFLAGEHVAHLRMQLQRQGAGRILVLAGESGCPLPLRRRDPAHWDLQRAQNTQYNAQALAKPEHAAHPLAGHGADRLDDGPALIVAGRGGQQLAGQRVGVHLLPFAVQTCRDGHVKHLLNVPIVQHRYGPGLAGVDPEYDYLANPQYLLYQVLMLFCFKYSCLIYYR